MLSLAGGTVNYPVEDCVSDRPHQRPMAVAPPRHKLLRRQHTALTIHSSNSVLVEGIVKPRLALRHRR